MQTSVETISGKLCTVIKRPFDAEWVREQLAMGMPYMYEAEDGYRGNFYPKIRTLVEKAIDIGRLTPKYVITILPALPRRPTPEHAPLLYRYASEDVFVVGTGHDGPSYPNGLGLSGILHLSKTHKGKAEITHATDTNGNKIEIAIEEE